jgi:AbrB family looped-hinge helix DNA binding protein
LIQGTFVLSIRFDYIHMLVKIREIQSMPLAKITGKRQVTIPKEIFDDLNLQVGDLVEFRIEKGNAVVTPQRLTANPKIPKLTKQEQATLKKAQKKIHAINTTPLNSRGLTKAEIEVAAKVGIIDKDQAWYWTEEWQKGEREAKREIANGDMIGPFDNAEDAIAALKAL